MRQAGQERVALAMRDLGVLDGRVAFGANGGQRRLRVGQRRLDAVQLIVGGSHPQRLLPGLGDRADIPVALIPQFRDVRRRGAQSGREKDDEGHQGHAEKEDERNDGLSNGDSIAGDEQGLRALAMRSPGAQAGARESTGRPLRTARGDGGARPPRS